MSFSIAIIGRPNVGKSTLFNRLTGRKTALVADEAGLTRDRKFGEANIGPMYFDVIDTAGLERVSGQSIEELMMIQTEIAIDQADIILMMIDGRAGLTQEDQHFAKFVRNKNKPTIMVANKCESPKAISEHLDDCYRLGFGEIIAIAAEHGLGMAELYEAILGMAKDNNLEISEARAKKDEVLQIAIAGRPNVGKSTLFNKIVGENRAIESDIAGTTRDSIYVELEYKGRNIKLVDTAGMRKKSKRNEEYLEKISVDESLRSIQYANVVVLMLDATQAFDKMDLSIADHVISEGRGIIVALNKWDLIKDKKSKLKDIEHKIDHSLSQARNVPIVTLSALDGKNIKEIMKRSLQIFNAWNSRISTGRLNNWLSDATEQHMPPLSKGRRIKLRYITQAKTRPPTFVLFTTSNVKDLPDSYLKYLHNSIINRFGFQGTSMRILLRKSDNPYK